MEPQRKDLGQQTTDRAGPTRAIERSEGKNKHSKPLPAARKAESTFENQGLGAGL